MNSKDWKLGLLVIMSATLLTACQRDKKKPAATPFTGIWVVQDNLKDYAAHSSELRGTPMVRDNFCNRVYRHAERYGDRDLNLRALLIQPNGEVFLYRAGVAVNSPTFRAENFIGTVTADGNFVAGAIGPRGEVTRAWVRPFVTQWGIPNQTKFYMRGNVLQIYTAGDIVMLERTDNYVMDDYITHVPVCLKNYYRWRDGEMRRRQMIPQKDQDFPEERQDRRQVRPELGPDEQGDVAYPAPLPPPGAR